MNAIDSPFVRFVTPNCAEHGAVIIDINHIVALEEADYNVTLISLRGTDKKYRVHSPAQDIADLIMDRRSNGYESEVRFAHRVHKELEEDDFEEGNLP